MRATLLGCSSSPERTLAESSQVPATRQNDKAVHQDSGLNEPSQVMISFLEGASGGCALRRATAIVGFGALWRRQRRFFQRLAYSLAADGHEVTRSRFMVRHSTRLKTTRNFFSKE